MILTPFIIGNIYKLSSYFEKEFYESDVITPIERQGHIIVAGFAMLGKIVAASLQSKGSNFVIISDNLKHVLHARKLGYMAYFGHLNKLPALESLMVKEAKAIIITMSSEQNRRLISEAVLNYDKNARIIIKIDSAEERKSMRDLSELTFVDASFEVAELLVNHALHDE
jgi:CPA2 family monovalent cation:H+ antiporter-2